MPSPASTHRTSLDYAARASLQAGLPALPADTELFPSTDSKFAPEGYPFTKCRVNAELKTLEICLSDKF
jgi:hypothetical protein